MIGQLTGFVGQVENDCCIIDVNGVGYVVFASTQTLGQLAKPPEIARVFIETIVREDAIQLYGFAELEEREWFRLLTTVQGVGSRVALAILSVSQPIQLLQAINASDKQVFTQAAGVGPRLATRILTELKPKVAKMPGSSQNLQAPILDSAPGASIEADALMALEGLGFRRAETWPVVSRLISENKTSGLDQIIRLSLQELARS
ncbi:Holliday junction branch migration protein RuvA [Aristophania vespae]|uniref:Holliday junction branch migration complex subunit RuvA n=1 Tax=Aristophania vespae TaxID=2697033 RepID=A0A6P1NK56_9PROT|nr:Holliday junction branch migration protein RuvA [Aristophania vespae]QHI95241.1 Holliday junction branch migration protein RuvA [Aristophania vespae]UMM64486.1 Holliday junction ATP-dependent DNA helicase RuvA [Aristophania vespae]